MKTLSLVIPLVLLVASSGEAQVTNGTFDGGLQGWTSSTRSPGCPLPVFIDSCGEQGACIEVSVHCPQPMGGTSCLQQVIACGDSTESDSCEVGFDVYAGHRPCFGYTVRHTLRAFVDNIMVYQFEGGYGTHDWQRHSFHVRSGVHQVSFEFYVYDGAVLWIDNVSASSYGGVPAIPATWGGIKASRQLRE